MTNAEQLRTLIVQHKLTRERVAELCDVSIHTVNAWLLPLHAKAWRNMPSRTLRHLQADLSTPSE